MESYLASWIIWILAVIAGWVLLSVGERLPRRGDWLSALVSLLILGGALGIHIQGGPMIQRGWISPHSDPHGLGIAFGVDRITLAVLLVGFIALWTVLLFSISNRFESLGPRVSRIYAALVFSSIGLSVSWISQTPWLEWTGCVLAAFSAYLVMPEAFAAKLFWVRSIGLALVWIAFSGMTASPDLRFFWAAIGLFGILTSAFIIPLINSAWKTNTKEPLFAPVTVMGWWIPALCLFSLLVRNELNIFAEASPVLGSITLLFVLLLMIQGLLEKNWSQAFWSLGFSGMGLAVAVFLFSGAGAGLVVVLGTALVSVLLLGISKDGICENSKFIKTTRVIASLAVSGLPGFLASGGYLRWLDSGLRHGLGMWVGYTFSFYLFIFAALSLRTGLLGHEAEAATQKQRWPIFVISLLFLLGFSVIWSGHLMGGILEGPEDLVLRPLIALPLLGGGVGAEAWAMASRFCWIAVALGWMISIWIYLASRKRKDELDILSYFSSRFPKIIGFFEGGIGIYFLADRLGSIFEFMVLKLDWETRFVDKSGTWLSRIFDQVADHLCRMDDLIFSGSTRAIGRAIVVPSKLIQLVQNGDIQWYLFFGIGSGVVLLLHFISWRS